MSERLKSDESSLPVPEFRNTIPEHVLSRLPDNERYILEALSKLENQSNWTLNALVNDHAVIFAMRQSINSIDDQMRDMPKQAAISTLNVTVKELWDWHLLLKGKWVVIGTVSVVMLSAVLSVILKYLLDALTKK